MTYPNPPTPERSPEVIRKQPRLVRAAAEALGFPTVTESDYADMLARGLEPWQMAVIAAQGAVRAGARAI